MGKECIIHCLKASKRELVSFSSPNWPSGTTIEFMMFAPTFVIHNLSPLKDIAQRMKKTNFT